MTTFEDIASDLTTTLHQLKAKRQKLKKQIDQDQDQSERIESQLQILIERRKQIEGSMKQYRHEKDQLQSIIGQTQQTKKKIIQSLKYLGANLKKLKIHDKL